MLKEKLLFKIQLKLKIIVQVFLPMLEAFKDLKLSLL